MTIHPDLGISGKRPDFLISSEKLEFVVEAQVVSGKSKEEARKERLTNEFYDNINKLNLKGFFIHIDEIEFKSTKQPSTRALKAFLKEEISNLDKQEIQEKLKSGGFANLNSLIYENEDVRIIINAIPMDQIDDDEYDKKIIGMWPMKFSTGRELECINKAIQKKASKYKKIGYPLLVCINSHIVFMTRKLDAQYAIWGTYGEDIENYNGIFHHNKKFINKGLNGVMITKVWPGNIPSAECWIFKHPNSKLEMDFKALKMSFDDVKGYQIHNNEGLSINDVFKIDPEWLSGFD